MKTKFQNGGVIPKWIIEGTDKVMIFATPESLIPKECVVQQGIQTMQYIIDTTKFVANMQDVINDGKNKGNIMLGTSVTELKVKIQQIIDSTNWNQFKSQNTMVPTIEIKALLLGAVKKSNKILSSIEENTSEGNNDAV